MKLAIDARTVNERGRSAGRSWSVGGSRMEGGSLGFASGQLGGAVVGGTGRSQIARTREELGSRGLVGLVPDESCIVAEV